MFPNSVFVFLFIAVSAFLAESSHAQEAASGPTVSNLEMLEARMAKAPALDFEQVREFFNQTAQAQLTCVPENSEEKSPPEILLSFIPAFPEIELTFSLAPDGDGFNILVSRKGKNSDGSNFSAQGNLECNADENFMCPNLTWKSSRTVPFTMKDYAPTAAIDETYEIYPVAQGQLYIRYGFSITTNKYDFFGRSQVDAATAVNYVCKQPTP